MEARIGFRRRRNHLLAARVSPSVRPGAARQERKGPRTTLVVVGLCLGSLSTLDVNAQTLVLECSIGGEGRSEVVIVDPISKFVHAGNRIIQAEVTAQSIIWEEDGSLRMIDRGTGAVLHRLPDDSYFHIGQCRSSKRKF